jgi:peptide/nickel transport system substrate-binding protein
MRPVFVGAAIAAATVALGAGDAAGRGASGFVLRVGDSIGPESLDPAIAASRDAAAIEYATCMKLVNLPDREGRAAEIPVLEAADRLVVSKDGRRYTFRVRRGLRFSDGRPLTAADFAYTFQRLLNPGMNSIVFQAHALDDVVGVRERRLGTAARVTGIFARGSALTIRLTHRAPDFLARLATPQACPVPVGFPVDPAGVSDPPVPGSGPYAIGEYRPGREIVLVRNRYYHGGRPHRPDSIDITIGGSEDDLASAVDRGEVDYMVDGPPVSRLDELERRFGINRTRLYIRARPQTLYLAFNVQRPLFRNNARLRRAIGFALDRPAVIASMGNRLLERPTDQLLPPALPGFVDRHLYPIGRPNLAEARRLARGNLRGGHATLYVSSSPTALARGNAVQRALARIGFHVSIRPWGVDVFQLRLALPKEPYDMAIILANQSWPDAGAFLYPILGARSIPGPVYDPLKYNFSRFRDSAFEQGFDVAERSSGKARQNAFARLEARVLTWAAPVAPIYYPNDVLFFSARIGCVTYNPTFTIDYAALCQR